MDITQWYAVFLGVFIMLPMITWIARCISSLAQECQHVLHKYVFISRKITRLEALLIPAILVANAMCISLDVHSQETLMYRSGLLSSINFAFLSFGYQMSYFYKSSVMGYNRIHYWVAGITITEASLHSVTAIILRKWKTDIVSQITTWTAFSTIIIVLMSSLAIPTGRYYEAFEIIHRFSPAVIIATVWVHAGTSKVNTVPTIYMLGSACILTITWCFWLVRIIYRNLKIGSKLPQATIKKDGKIMIVSITLPRRWNLKAGQHIKLCTPSLQWGSILQWHPFAISSYELVNGKMVIHLIIRERKGFTAILANKWKPDQDMVALIDGPYGNQIQLRTYGTVLLFASGIGIAGLLPYAQQTLEDYDAQRTNCRRLFLFWEIDDSTAYLSIIQQHVYRLSSHSIFELRLIYTRLDIETEIYNTITLVPGSIAVITCVSQKASKEAREKRQDLLEKNVHLFELEFCPKLVFNDKEQKLGR